MIPNNSGAAFMAYNSRLIKPSELLLHYTYGATAVRLWGHGLKVLGGYFTFFRPPKPVPNLIGPSRQIHTRQSAIEKWEKAQAAAEAKAKKTGAGEGSKGKRREGEMTWDEDVMLFFWGNSRAAKEHNIKMHEEKVQNMERCSP